MIMFDEIEAPAFRRQIAATYVSREDDGSHGVRHFHEAVCENAVTVLHTAVAADFLVDAYNQVWKSQRYREGVANGQAEALMAEAA